MARVTHFEIHCEDPDRAMQFYSHLFQWQFQQFADNEYWLITTGPDSEPGINGGLIRRRGGIDGTSIIAFVCTVDVKSVDECALKVATLGGTVVVPKMAIPEIGWLTYVKDTEGNILGLMQADPQAK